jgi:hypothetical protein
MKIFLPFLFAVILMGCHHDNQKTINHNISSENYPAPQATLMATLMRGQLEKQALYDSAAGLTGVNRASLSLMHQQASSFHSYMTDLRSRFMKFCGDPGGLHLPAGKYEDLELTHVFFIKQKAADTLYMHLAMLKETFQVASNDSSINGDIANLDNGFSGSVFIEKYFNDLPAIAASVILTDFNNKVETLELKILYSYFNQKK